MKCVKFLSYAALTLTALLLLGGCADTDDNRITMSDICVFRQRNDGVPIKTVLSGGITSTVCVDLSVYTELFLGYADGKLALAFMDEVPNRFYDSGYDYNISPDIIIVDTSDGTWRVSEDET